MASGFLILPDGRCFARVWSYYDAVIEEIAESLRDAPEERELKNWLLLLLPGPGDQEHLGYGPWLRSTDQTIVERHLDLRELTGKNQQLFMRAAKDAATTSHDNPHLHQCFLDLAEMIERIEAGEAAFSKSDWREVVPSKGRRIGPGWIDQETQ